MEDILNILKLHLCNDEILEEDINNMLMQIWLKMKSQVMMKKEEK